MSDYLSSIQVSLIRESYVTITRVLSAVTEDPDAPRSLVFELSAAAGMLGTILSRKKLIQENTCTLTNSANRSS